MASTRSGVIVGEDSGVAGWEKGELLGGEGRASRREEREARELELGLGWGAVVGWALASGGGRRGGWRSRTKGGRGRAGSVADGRSDGLSAKGRAREQGGKAGEREETVDELAGETRARPARRRRAGRAQASGSSPGLDASRPSTDARRPAAAEAEEGTYGTGAMGSGRTTTGGEGRCRVERAAPAAPDAPFRSLAAAARQPGQVSARRRASIPAAPSACVDPVVDFGRPATAAGYGRVTCEDGLKL